jgi:hypothetical protein
MSEELPLDFEMDLNDVHTEYPVLPTGLYNAKVTKVTRVPQKENPNAFNLAVRFELQQHATAESGKNIDPGFPVTRRYPLQPPTDKPESTYFREELARLQDALTGSSLGDRPRFTPSALLDRYCRIHLTIREDEKYGRQNELKAVLPPE